MKLIICFGSIILIIALIITACCYALYDYTFYYPYKKRKNYQDLPSPAYDKYRDNMIREIQLMESISHEVVKIKSYDGIILRGYFYNNYPKRPIVLFFHGYKSCFQWDGYGIFRYCRENNLNCLMVEQRAHGDSSTKTICFGIKERYDCLSWANYLTNILGNDIEIILAGVSMGSATVMMASDLLLPNSIKGIIADCGYTSPEEIIVNTAKNLGLPADLLNPFTKLAFRVVANVNMNDAKAIVSVKKTNIPILFIHGEEDDFVPLIMGKKLYSECKSEKAILIVPGARHAVSAMENFALYDNKITEFLSKIIKVTND